MTEDSTTQTHLQFESSERRPVAFVGLVMKLLQIFTSFVFVQNQEEKHKRQHAPVFYSHLRRSLDLRKERVWLTCMCHECLCVCECVCVCAYVSPWGRFHQRIRREREHCAGYALLVEREGGPIRLVCFCFAVIDGDCTGVNQCRTSLNEECTELTSAKGKV